MTNEIARLEEIVSHDATTKAHLDTTQEGYLSEIAGLKTQLSDMSEMLQTGEELKQDKAKEVSDLKATVADLKQQQAAFEEVQGRLSKLEESTHVEHAEHAVEVADLKETITQLQQEQLSAKDARQEAELQTGTKIEELTKENAKLAGRMNMCEVNLDAALEDAEALVDELQRARDLEQTLYKEKEELQSKYEQSQESKLRVEEDYAKTQHQLNELRSEADKLIGHQNTSQKIQLHLQIKKENNSLKTEINKLKTQLKQAGSTIKRPLGERNALKA
jgi:chromosome segregation ATPase